MMIGNELQTGWGSFRSYQAAIALNGQSARNPILSRCRTTIRQPIWSSNSKDKCDIQRRIEVSGFIGRLFTPFHYISDQKSHIKGIMKAKSTPLKATTLIDTLLHTSTASAAFRVQCAEMHGHPYVCAWRRLSGHFP